MKSFEMSSELFSESDEGSAFSIEISAKSVIFESSSVLNVESSPLVKSSFWESAVANCESSLNISEKSVESKSGKSSSSVLLEKSGEVSEFSILSSVDSDGFEFSFELFFTQTP